MFQKPELWQIPQIETDLYATLPEKVEQLAERLRHIAQHYRNAKFASSLAVEDMVITDVIAQVAPDIRIFTLETGRLNKETEALIEQVQQHYPTLTFELYRPNAEQAQQYDEQQGRYAFYESVELRRQCCFIRKIEPLNRALQGADAWISGQRREQSVTRSELPLFERDEVRAMDKFNPIFDWSEREVWAYILKHQVPYNSLYQQGYPSIGCDPCTRPIKRSEDIRAGRWWWENRDNKECGLHK